MGGGQVAASKQNLSSITKFQKRNKLDGRTVTAVKKEQGSELLTARVQEIKRMAKGIKKNKLEK